MRWKIKEIIFIFAVGLFLSPAAMTQETRCVQISESLAYNFGNLIDLGVLEGYPPNLIVPGSSLPLEELFWLLQRSRENLQMQQRLPSIRRAATLSIANVEDELYPLLGDSSEEPLGTKIAGYNEQLSTIKKDIIKQKEWFNVQGNTRFGMEGSGLDINRFSTHSMFQDGNIRFYINRDQYSLTAGLSYRINHGGGLSHSSLQNLIFLQNVNRQSIIWGYQYISLSDFLCEIPNKRKEIFGIDDEREAAKMFAGIHYSGQTDTWNWYLFRGKQLYLYNLPMNIEFVEMKTSYPLQIFYGQSKLFNTSFNGIRNSVRTLGFLWDESLFRFEGELAQSLRQVAEGADAERGSAVKLSATRHRKMQGADLILGIKLFKIGKAFMCINSNVIEANKFEQLVPGGYFNNLGGFATNLSMRLLEGNLSILFNHEEHKALSPPSSDLPILSWKFNEFTLANLLPWGKGTMNFSSEWGRFLRSDIEEHYYIFGESIILPFGNDRYTLLGKQEIFSQYKSNQVGIRSLLTVANNVRLEAEVSKIISSSKTEDEGTINLQTDLSFMF